MKIPFGLLSIAALLTITSLVPWAASAQSPTTATASGGIMRDLIEHYTTDSSALERFYNIPISPARTERLKRFYEDETKQLNAVDFSKLDQDSRIDYLLFKSQLRYEQRELEHAQKRLAASAALVPFAEPVIQLEEARRRMEPVYPERSAKILTDLSKQIAIVQKDLEQRLKADKNASTPVPDKVNANRAARAVDDLRRALKSWHDFYSGYDPEFTWWVDQPFQKTDKDLYDYGSFLRKKIVGHADGEEEPVIGDPIGRQALLDALEYERIPYTPEELLEIANKEFAWCEKEMHRVSRQLGFGDDWHKALEHVSNLHAKPGDQPRIIKELADEATRFVEQRDLVTVPELCKETWHMEMMPPERQKVNPYFTGGEVISVSYPNAAMAYEDKMMGMRGNNIHFSHATVFHELIPGHHLQLYMAARYHPYREAFRTPFLVEGWALYWEMLMWDLKFARSPEDEVGMLFWRSHRCARIIFSLNFHLGKMTPQEAIDFLVDKVGHERRNATAEVRRSVAGEYSPLYQAAYMLGGLQIRSIRHELVDSGKLTNKAFHDAILHENAIPIELIRASLTHQPLTQDFAPQWRFYDLK